MYAHNQRLDSEEVQGLRREGGRFLKELREARGLSQRQLATLVGAEYYTFISQLETGRGRIPPDRYRAWAKALGIEVRQFVQTLMRFYDPLTYEILFGAETDVEPSPPPLRVIIAEAHPIVLVGLTNILHTLGYVLVGSVASGQEAIHAAGEHHPDLMLMDVDLRGDMDGIAAAVESHNRLGIRCVFLAEQVDATMRTRAAAALPVAILDKTAPMSVITDALRIAPPRTIH